MAQTEEAQAEQLKKHGDVKEALDLMKKLLARLNAAPERVGFPKSNLR